jgi:hypothetical protein
MAEPVFLGLLAADKVITEEGNRKKTIVGTFTNLHTKTFPAVFPPWAIYASVTNISGEHSFSVNVANPTTEMVVFSAGGTLNVKEPKAVVELAIPVAAARFPEEGTYTIIFNVDGYPVGSRTLNVSRAQKAQ